MNLIDAIRHHTKVRPFDMAVIHPNGAVNYQQLASVVAKVAARLRQKGVAPDTTMAIYVSDPFTHLTLILAAMLNGTRSISSHPNFDPLPDTLQVDHWLVDRPLPFTPQGGVVTQIGPNWTAEAGNDARAPLEGTGFADADVICRLFTSSGTTGVPKVIGHSTRTLETSVLRQLSMEPASRGPNLSMMWMSTIGGFGTVQTTLWHGTALVMATGVQQTLRYTGLYRVANLRASPQQLQGLVSLVAGRIVRFPNLERIEVGGSSIPTAVMISARATLCPNVVGVYGSTETALVAQAPGAVLHSVPDAAGFVVPGAQARIVDDEGQPLGFDVEGHVQTRSPYMACEYIGDPQGTARAFKDGWFVPGDLGVLRADGLLRITGRADEMINAGGVKLSPSVVDEFLLTIAGVRDAAAFAHRRPGKADEVWAAVVVSEEFDERAALEHARLKLNSRAPLRLIQLEEIPRNAMGKVMRQELAKTAVPAAR
ncbi:class I adenylate-forming enzyme family protein [Caenimonas koreensis]|uniref:AMP-binding protein n=1 Tax=Caenimonas koreensis DSM 17982 TaxID=1121255 RepID=A0A844B1S7_9BURK|nr:fatty acid--CoA ligase family protein [Caenimonas koreensis]MRD45669.1 AMP-binding protein [Caenimonas koreensis DSM 17982]